MPIDVLMPALSPTMTEGKLARWLKAEGDPVAAGDLLAEIETDKATMEMEAVEEGTLGRILVPEGTEGVAVNTPIARLLAEGEDAAALDAEPAQAGPQPPPSPQAETPAAKDDAPKGASKAPRPAPGPATPPADRSRVFASPLARRLAARHGIDLAALSGRGPRGRILKADIEAAVEAGGTAPQPAAGKTQAEAPETPQADDPLLFGLPPHEAKPHSSMRRTIARRLTASARDVPHFSVAIDVDLDPLLRLRADLNGRIADKADRISVNDLIVKATGAALVAEPRCNVAFTEAAILHFSRVDIALAVALDDGLITPVIRDVPAKSLSTLHAEARRLAEKARAGKLTPEEYSGGTFTISNMGMFGVKSFTSILNPPQGGILSVGAGERRPVVRGDELAVGTVLSLNLAVDHRCIDGAVAAAFMARLKGLIEDPITLML
ncbi:pyruvate dehydrogenase complex dihydrolipoamide acetyltransferase [Roseospirillum parvum]|uniref:Acetyltransferase component of pyruvate dehydrogenase complex n=1 Tax=Roseospirillum parvum TaxID=83401 RepID=A0A1G7YGI3_9PROT|nr:pyruvate dehydrogenase complex dihydrolipoamide acetyltransferase [Roseospirillum parvum]SDG95497.1 pyruvate dehydrogenase E2 component (dihydrolipoamide acetyltransferase) [Roseospirillum parvum]